MTPDHYLADWQPSQNAPITTKVPLRFGKLKKRHDLFHECRIINYFLVHGFSSKPGVRSRHPLFICGIVFARNNFRQFKNMAICHSQELFSNQNNKGASGAFRPEVIAVLFKAHSNGRAVYISKFIILITIVTLLLSDGVWRPLPTTVECFHHCDRQLPFLLSSPAPAQFVDLCTNNFSFSICPVRDIICLDQVCDIYIYIYTSRSILTVSAPLHQTPYFSFRQQLFCVLFFSLFF